MGYLRSKVIMSIEWQLDHDPLPVCNEFDLRKAWKYSWTVPLDALHRCYISMVAVSWMYIAIVYIYIPTPNMHCMKKLQVIYTNIQSYNIVI